MQAQNGSNSAADIDSIQTEVNQRMEEINRITAQTNFNGISMLNTGSGSAAYRFQVGAEDGETITIDLDASDSYNLLKAGTTGSTLNIRQMTSGDTVNGVARTVAAEGFDVLKGMLPAEQVEPRQTVRLWPISIGRLNPLIVSVVCWMPMRTAFSRLSPT